MRYCLLILSVLVLGGCGSKSNSSGAANVQSYYREFGLAAPAKRVVVKTYEARSKFGEVVKGELTDESYMVEFDTAAGMATRTYFDSRGDIMSFQRYIYKGDNLVEFMDLDSDEELNYRQVLGYEGDICTSIITTNYLASDDVPSVEICEYKFDGELVTEYIRKSEDGTVLSRGVYSYPEKNVEEVVDYGAPGEEAEHITRYYNDMGQIVKIISDNTYYEIEYNSRNLPIRFVNVAPYCNTLFAILSKTEEALYYADYRYDARGNWTTQIIYQGNMKRPYRISEREITY